MNNHANVFIFRAGKGRHSKHPREWKCLCCDEFSDNGSTGVYISDETTPLVVSVNASCFEAAVQCAIVRAAIVTDGYILQLANNNNSSKNSLLCMYSVEPTRHRRCVMG